MNFFGTQPGSIVRTTKPDAQAHVMEFAAMSFNLLRVR
jgi:hypothetical protein